MNSNTTSPVLATLGREPPRPVEGFGDLHLSGSEPKIFPGIVSKRQRRDSLRQNSMSETDDHGSVGTGGRKGKGGRRRLDGTVDEEAQDSYGNMGEAGGMDE